VDFAFNFVYFLSSSFSKICPPKLAKTSRRRKNRETLVQAFRSTASPAAYPGEGTDFCHNETQLIYRRPWKYRASLVASELTAARP
jgi:hypothetical protein